MIFSKEYEKYYIEEMQDAIGLIDFKALDNNNFEVLYYLFPLIERIFIDILKYSIISDIEIYSQGTFRTLESALKKRENLNCFDSETIEVLNTFYCKQGLRNKLFHYRGQTIMISGLDIKAIKLLGLKLLKQYKKTLENATDFKDLKIDFIE